MRTSALVREVYEAYRVGRIKPRDTAIDSALKEFLAAVRNRIVPGLSRRELFFTAQCKRYCNLAREAAGRADINTACQLVGAAQACAGAQDLGVEARLLCRSEIAPVEGYLDLCCGDLQAATRHYLRAMETDQELEQGYGHRLLHGHRIHLQINMVGVEARTWGTRQAMARALWIFRYLSGTSNTMPFPGEWGLEFTKLLSAEMLQFFALQLTYEIAGVLAELPANAVRGHLGVLLDNKDFFDTRDFWNPTTRGWIELKALLTGDISEYLNRSLDFLARGPDRSFSIWETAALDAALICGVLCPGLADDFQREVAEEMGRLSYVPRPLQRLAWRTRKRLSGEKFQPDAGPGTANLGSCNVLSLNN